MNSLISRLQRPGYDLQKEQAIQEAIVMLRQCNAQSKPDCGEAGHDEGRCGNVQCLPGAAAPNFADAYQGAMEEVAIWKKRALEAEELNRKFIAEINGPTYMGEPAQPAPRESSHDTI